MLLYLWQEGMLVAIKSLPTRSMLNIAGICSTVRPLFSSSKPCTDVSISYCTVFILGEAQTQEDGDHTGLWICVRWLMLTNEWPADNNLLSRSLLLVAMTLQYQVEAGPGSGRTNCFKQREPYGTAMHFTACTDQKQTCFAPLCTTALYILITQSL